MFSLKRNDTGQSILYLNENQVTEADVRKMFEGVKPSEDQPVSLAADRGIEYGEVMRVIDMLESLGLKKLALDTRHVETR